MLIPYMNFVYVPFILEFTVVCKVSEMDEREKNRLRNKTGEGDISV